MKSGDLLSCSGLPGVKPDVNHGVRATLVEKLVLDAGHGEALEAAFIKLGHFHPRIRSVRPSKTVTSRLSPLPTRILLQSAAKTDPAPAEFTLQWL